MALRRIIRVTVAGAVVEDTRVSFTVERQWDETQTTGAVEIYNLSRDRESLIYERGGALEIVAGYELSAGVIFEGRVQRVTRERRKRARVTRISIGDLVRAPDRLGGVTSRSYRGPVLARSVVVDLANDVGLPAGPLDAIPEHATVTDYAWHGVSVEGLTSLLRGYGCVWYEDDGLLRFRKAGVPQPDAVTVRVSAETGMIGSPTQTDEGAEVKTFLRSDLRLGGRVDLRSVTLGGVWLISALRQTADNWDGPFSSWCDLRAIA